MIGWSKPLFLRLHPTGYQRSSFTAAFPMGFYEVWGEKFQCFVLDIA